LRCPILASDLWVPENVIWGLVIRLTHGNAGARTASRQLTATSLENVRATRQSISIVASGYPILETGDDDGYCGRSPDPDNRCITWGSSLVRSGTVNATR
jgi:hypothetical protein